MNIHFGVVVVLVVAVVMVMVTTIRKFCYL
jgi:hypothetical protein